MKCQIYTSARTAQINLLAAQAFAAATGDMKHA